MEVDRALERINGVRNFQGVSIVRRILRSASSVCRILIQNNFGVSGYGTGFLVSPHVLITNNHVLPDPDTARQSVAQFNYEIDDGGRVLTPVSFRLRPEQFFLTSTYKPVPGSPFDGRDFTLVAVEPAGSDGAPLDRFGFIRMDGTLGKIIEGETCVVIQHPKGDYKKIVLKDIRLITLTENFLIYESDTLPGSSGSVVLGLGTASVVGLHHSSIPRKDAAGNWLRKAGTPAQPNDPDEAIDWIGNEGVRVSCIVEAFNNLPLPDAMQAMRRQLIESQTPPLTLVNPVAPSHPFGPPPVPGPRTPAPVAVSVSAKPESTAASSLQYFEIVLSEQESLRNDWETRAAALVDGLVDDTPLMPGSLDPLARRMRYLTVQSGENPWELAARFEALPQVQTCTPDLPTLTDVGVAEGPAAAGQFESFSRGADRSGLSTWQSGEQEFLKTFGGSDLLLRANAVRTNYHRWWNWLAINCPEDGQRTTPLWRAIAQKLPSMRLVQLDTGYSTHSKVFRGFDTDKDFDFIDGDFDARDLLERKLLKHPGHGTRTGSLAVGGTLTSDPNALDGNGGLLTVAGEPGAKLIPYRISKSVVRLGRGKQLVDAARYALRSGADVLFMSMGTYPRAMFAALAREVYEHGVIWVCAAGNEAELVVAPALYPGTIAVAATNPNDDPWRGSSNGPMVGVAAPGESVYVPTVDDDEGNEGMAYGDGTSYATPQVASAALLWKAHHYDELLAENFPPWQVVEAFRKNLRDSARRPANWTKKTFEVYSAGILDVENLLAQPLPKPSELAHAYADQPADPPADLGIVEAGHFIWNIFKRKVRGGPAESARLAATLTPRGRTELPGRKRRPHPAAPHAQRRGGRGGPAGRGRAGAV